MVVDERCVKVADNLQKHLFTAEARQPAQGHERQRCRGAQQHNSQHYVPTIL